MADRRVTGYVFRVFVAGQSEHTRVVVGRLRALCESLLAGGYELEIVDVGEHPELADLYQVVVFPTAVRTKPLPQLRVIGDFSDDARTAAGLGLPDPFTKRGEEPR